MAASYIRNAIVSSYKPKKEYHTVYIARGDNNRLVNEDEVIALMGQIGIEVINPKNNSYYDILNAFMTANFIIGVTGTGLVNMILMKPESRMLIICPFEFQHDEMIGIADAAKRDILFIHAELSEHGEVMNHCKFFVDVERLRNKIKDIEIKRQ